MAGFSSDPPGGRSSAFVCHDCGKAMATSGGLEIHRAQWCSRHVDLGEGPLDQTVSRRARRRLTRSRGKADATPAMPTAMDHEPPAPRPAPRFPPPDARQLEREEKWTQWELLHEARLKAAAERLGATADDDHLLEAQLEGAGRIPVDSHQPEAPSGQPDGLFNLASCLDPDSGLDLAAAEARLEHEAARIEEQRRQVEEDRRQLDLERRELERARVETGRAETRTIAEAEPSDAGVDVLNTLASGLNLVVDLAVKKQLLRRNPFRK